MVLAFRNKTPAIHYLYQPNFLHKGTIERLIVRLGRLAGQGEEFPIWRNGFLMQEQEKDALIVCLREEGLIEIKLFGIDCNYFLQKILKELYLLNPQGKEFIVFEGKKVAKQNFRSRISCRKKELL